MEVAVKLGDATWTGATRAPQTRAIVDFELIFGCDTFRDLPLSGI